MKKILEKKLREYKINEYDILYVASSGFAVYWNKNFVKDTLGILEEIMKNKTLILPTFSFDFCDTGIYDVKKATTYCGLLSEEFLKDKNVKRTMYTPMHNVAIKGKLQNYFISKKYKTSFGEDSIFNDFGKFKTGVLLIDCSFEDGVAFLHCIEEKNNSKDRKYKVFKGIIKDYDGNEIKYKFRRFVRIKKDIPTIETSDFIEKHTIQFSYKNSHFIFFKLNDFNDYYKL